MMHDYWWYGGYDIVGFIFMLLMMAALVVAVILAIRYLNRTSQAPPGNRQEDDAMEILKKRYANGEIDKQEFDDKRKQLGA